MKHQVTTGHGLVAKNPGCSSELSHGGSQPPVI